MTENAVVKASFEIGNRGLRPKNLTELWRLGEMMVMGGIAPKGMTKEGACAVIAFGMELGLSPIQSLRDVCFINGRPSAYGDAVSALLLGSHLLDGLPVERMEGQGENTRAICTMKRKGMTGACTREFSWADAKRAKLTDKDNWRNYPARMLRWRAFSLCARDLFSDVLKGLWVREEVEDVPVQDIPSRSVPEPVEEPKAIAAPSQGDPFSGGLEQELAQATEQAQAPAPVHVDAPAQEAPPATTTPLDRDQLWVKWQEMKADIRPTDVHAILSEAGLQMLNAKSTAADIAKVLAKANEWMKE